MNLNLTLYMIILTIFSIVSADNPCLNLTNWVNYKSNVTSKYLKDSLLTYQIQFDNKSYENIACINYQANLLLNEMNISNSSIDAYFKKYSEKLTIKNDIINVISVWASKDRNIYKGMIFTDEGSKAYDRYNNKRQVQKWPDTNGIPYEIYKAKSNYSYKSFFSYSGGYDGNPGLMWFTSWSDQAVDQGGCGNCWAYTAVAAVQGAIFKFYGNKIERLSIQQLTDCSSDSYGLNYYGNSGCDGGNVWNAFKYIYQNGLVKDWIYPFYSGDINVQGKCTYNSALNWKNEKYATFNATFNGKPYRLTDIQTLVFIRGMIRVDPGDDNALIQVLDTYGPVAVAIDGSSKEFKNHKSGVFDGTGTCSKDRIDHFLLLVGYGAKANGKKYWIVKNQWSKSWGVGSFGLISRNITNNCGISSYAFAPLLYDSSYTFTDLISKRTWTGTGLF